MNRRELIFLTIDDMVADFLTTDRREDEELPRGEIEKALDNREISIKDMADRFKTCLESVI